jgi:hypothetical protein
MPGYVVDRTKQHTTGHRMDAAEPLIIKYQLKDWYNPHYHGNDPDKIALAPLKRCYRGIVVQ